MENKYCSKCGNKLEKEQEFCSKCGNKVSKEKSESVVISKEEKIKKKGKAGDIIRYIFGALFALGSLANLINGNWYGIIELLFSLSLMPFLYRNILCKYINNPKVLKTIQIVLPIVLFILFFMSPLI